MSKIAELLACDNKFILVNIANVVEEVMNLKNARYLIFSSVHSNN